MKAHLLTTEAAILTGRNRTADCGKEIKEAQILFMWDGLEMGKMVLSSLNVCEKCLDAKKGGEGARYLYGMAEKQHEN